ncbi:transposase [Streptomyces labedae]|uniref:Transposase n=1 Tax=Streptomyces labedae TaxID=285569 RepID=A0ABP6R0U7_9ACTN
MAMKDYSNEFKADAVATYESKPGATYKSIAADLGINRATLREWPAAARSGAAAQARAGQPAPSTDPDERIRQLEARVAELEASERKLATEREHPAQGGQVFRRRVELVNRVQFVHDHRNSFVVKRLCQVLGVHRSSYYKWRDGADARTARQAADQALAEQIRAVHDDSDGA